jgi:AraC family transcriptional regulator of adaptative response / DNA-3-methyladenine glycosylase II
MPCELDVFGLHFPKCSTRRRRSNIISASSMHIDWQAFRRARLARDPRFDGKFFVGVLSTKIYCRPSCPVPTVKDSNIRYFETAAAAGEAGFRPCLRCRPECSPGTPAWLGTPSTVSRALRLIAESGLEGGGVEGLAERMGVGSRHLRRLFVQHLGATPSAVAQTRRLHFAKKLIDETTLPMNQVALASGFGCVRRFNATILKTYRRTPTHLRGLGRLKDLPPDNQYLFRLHFRPPYDWETMLSFLALRATPGVETVEGGLYRRSISLGGEHGYFEVSQEKSVPALRVRVQFGNPSALFMITERIRRMFDLNADWMAIAATLNADPALAHLLETKPGVRLPGCWDGFELAVRAVLGQQITVKAATTFAGRLVRAFGKTFSNRSDLTHLFPTPRALADADLTRIGLTRARAISIQSLARAVHCREISFEGVVDPEILLAPLRRISGIGEWTAQYVAMRALGEPDAFPVGDVALLRKLNLRHSQELEKRAEAWRPWRAYAAVYLWCATGEPGARANKKKPAVMKAGEGSIAETSSPRSRSKNARDVQFAD